MNWTELELEAWQQQREHRPMPVQQPEKVRKPKVIPVLGEWRELEFSIRVPVPSFKNSKQLFMRAGKPTMATKPEYRVAMDTITAIVRHERYTRHPLTNVEYSFRFLTANLRQDDDGAAATLLDCLRDAGVIVDDCRKHVVCCKGLDWQLVDPDRQGVFVRLRGQEYSERTVERKQHHGTRSISKPAH